MNVGNFGFGSSAYRSRRRRLSSSHREVAPLTWRNLNRSGNRMVRGARNVRKGAKRWGKFVRRGVNDVYAGVKNVNSKLPRTGIKNKVRNLWSRVREKQSGTIYHGKTKIPLD
jgi:hypothetical protein